MSLLILCREPTEDVEKLGARLREQGIEVITASPKAISLQMHEQGSAQLYCNDQPIDPSLVLGWVSLWAREPGLWLLEAIEQMGIAVINGHDILSKGQSKLINSVMLHQHGIPHATTALVSNHAALERLLVDIGLPCVVKPIIGAKGIGVKKIDTRSELDTYAEQAFSLDQPIYVQQLMDKPDRDIRVRVIDYKAKFAFYRYLGDDGFITNLSQGGDWQDCQLTEQMIEISERCARMMDAPISGVDLVEAPDVEGGYRVIEVNTTPAFTWPNDENVADVVELIQSRLAAIGESAAR
jgi:[lysine-biosynthesis-protein LysW]--L-2-aminoadipate ligase